MAERSSDVIEVWLHKWEEAFAICEIRSDLKKIREATHMFIEAADRCWIKQQKDKVAPTTWEGFKSQFKKHFLPPDEESLTKREGKERRFMLWMPSETSVERLSTEQRSSHSCNDNI